LGPTMNNVLHTKLQPVFETTKNQRGQIPS
jgi:hypothetical protein